MMGVAHKHNDTASASSSSSAVSSGGPLCSALSSSSSSSAPHQLWVDHLPWILEHSQHPKDKRNIEQTKKFLYRISPRLPLFPSSLPRDSELVGRIVKKAWKRYQYVVQQKSQNSMNKDTSRNTTNTNTTNTTSEEPPPPILKILVLGGSVVTRGVNCWTGPARIETCNWAYRLGLLLNKMAGGKVAIVANHAIGASNTQVATTLLRFELLPEEIRRPDIIINAYSTNDMHFETIAEAVGSNATLRDHVFAMHQEFIRTAAATQPCQDPPLLIFLDDYLGNEQREILATTDVGQSHQILATYYGVGTVSYANMVRDIVYKNTREKDFSPAGWYKKDGSSGPTMTREIHPQFGMHYTVTWSMAYYFLVLVSTYCSTASALEKEQEAFPTTPSSLSSDHFDAGALPPVLTSLYSLADISHDWKASIQEQETKASLCYEQKKNDGKQPIAPRCTFSWMSMLASSKIIGKEERTKEWIEDQFKTYLTTKDQLSSWKIDDGGGKPGWSPVDGSAAPLTLEFAVETTPVSAVTVLYMRSYGEKWENSTVEMNIWQAHTNNAIDGNGRNGDNNNSMPLLHSQRIQGFHNKETSEIYPMDLELSPPIQPHSTLRIDFRLVAGTTFKILGLALCQ
jgi:hypothetical protein